VFCSMNLCFGKTQICLLKSRICVFKREICYFSKHKFTDSKGRFTPKRVRFEKANLPFHKREICFIWGKFVFWTTEFPLLMYVMQHISFNLMPCTSYAMQHGAAWHMWVCCMVGGCHEDMPCSTNLMQCQNPHLVMQQFWQKHRNRKLVSVICKKKT
jgi:hypothetical protein